MLKRMLATIATGRIGSTAELAAATGTSPEMIEALVAELERRGLLQRAGDCGSVCTGCPAEPSCGPAGQAHAWILTAAGRRYSGH